MSKRRNLGPGWLGTMPAMVKAFFAQVGHFATTPKEMKEWPQQMFKGKSARVIMTMRMPAAAYRFLFGADGVRGFENGILDLAGVKRIRSVNSLAQSRRRSCSTCVHWATG